ncbi:MAG: prepilin-type N-terminal cleavage/methylation domain-containing protein [Candidatus Pacebacteria bacterium]|nr:prepilin-type N-terminal cleavage/methylation domain-containing protein [Candidatus Paceibacterota bacterium]
MHKQSLKSQKGFTLIEVLVVVSIIGLLASVFLVGLSGFRARGRDSRRVADLKSIQNGLELYYSKNNSYPTTVEGYAILAGADAGLGISKVPMDPKTETAYDYIACDSEQSYTLRATLDTTDANDPLFNDSETTPKCAAYAPCTAPNFCVSL